MQAIVSLLDEVHGKLLEKIWKNLEENFGLTGVYINPFPHFSYHVAKDYQTESLKNTLTKITNNYKPFSVKTSAPQIFNGKLPVVYVPVVLDENLIALQQDIFNQVNAFSKKIVKYYNPSNWMPHITLAQGDVTNEMLPDVKNFLNNNYYDWEILIDNLAIIATIKNKTQSLIFKSNFNQ